VEVAAELAPNENDGAAAAGVAVDPKEGAEETEVTAPKAGTAAPAAGVEPNVNSPGAAEAEVTGAAEGAAPKVKGLTAATVAAVVVVVEIEVGAPNVGAAEEAAGAPEKLNSPEEGAATVDVSVLDEAVVLPPKLNGLVSAVVLFVDPNEGGTEAVADA